MKTTLTSYRVLVERPEWNKESIGAMASAGLQQSAVSKLQQVGDVFTSVKFTSQRLGTGLAVLVSDKVQKKVIFSVTVNKVDSSRTLTGDYLVCEDEDEVLTRLELRPDTDDSDTLVAHCLTSRRNQQTFYSLLHVTLS